MAARSAENSNATPTIGRGTGLKPFANRGRNETYEAQQDHEITAIYEFPQVSLLIRHHSHAGDLTLRRQDEC